MFPVHLVFPFGDDAGNTENAVTVDTGVFDFYTLTIMDEKCLWPDVKSADFEKGLTAIKMRSESQAAT